MTNPITPPPGLVQQWCLEAEAGHERTVAYSLMRLFAAKAAQWGADQELEACCEWLDKRFRTDPFFAKSLRTARRPKPPSLKEQALAVLDDCSDRLDSAHENTIRCALEALDD